MKLIRGVTSCLAGLAAILLACHSTKETKTPVLEEVVRRPDVLMVIASLFLLLTGIGVAQEFGTGPNHVVHLGQARGYSFCEILLIHGKPPDIVASVYNTSGASDCPPNKFDALDPKRLAEALHVDTVFKNARRQWMMDEMWLYTARETQDFDGVKATWMTTLPIRGALSGLGSVEKFPAYTPSKLQCVSKYVYKKGTEVYLIVLPDGHSWIMQTYTRTADPLMSEEELPKLGRMYKNLPVGWKFEVKTLQKDLFVTPPTDKNHMAHVMADEFDDLFEGCGYDAACSYIP